MYIVMVTDGGETSMNKQGNRNLSVRMQEISYCSGPQFSKKSYDKLLKKSDLRKT